jgi:hypothetical protein
MADKGVKDAIGIIIQGGRRRDAYGAVSVSSTVNNNG